MLKYVLKRIAYMLFTLFIVISVTFAMIHSIPGDPLASMARNLPEQTKANFYAKYGLDKPKSEQYKIFMKNLILHGDLGESIRFPGRSVADTIKTNSMVSAKLGGTALIVGIIIGVTLGIIAAIYKNKWPDYIVMFIAIIGITVPVFVTAALLQFFFTVKWPLLPTTGWGKPSNMVLPVIVLSLGSIATYARYVKSNMLEVLNQDYILTAQAKGVSSFNVITKHVLRNAMLPCLTILGGQIAGIFTGAFVTERIFGIPGLGFYYVSSINDRDYTMILGTTIFFAALFIIAQLVIDLLYGVVDPRIRVSGSGK